MSDSFSLNFLDAPPEFSRLKDAAIVVLPVPFERSTSWLEGTRGGPLAILEASGQVEYYNMETQTEVHKHGIFTDQPLKAGSAEELIRVLSEKVGKFLDMGKFVVVLGGEHSISLAPVKTALERFEPLTILHLDAHSDMRDEYLGDPNSHACVMARVQELTKDIAMVGVRSMDSSELGRLKNVKLLSARDFLRATQEEKSAFIHSLSNNVYLSFDVDVLDPSIMPSTGTPEPGGLHWYGVLDFLKELFRLKNVVGMDVVELAPNPQNKAPDFLVAKLITTLLSYKFYYQGQ
jgi:agmatinase